MRFSPSHLTSPSVPWCYTCFWLLAWESSLNFNSDNMLDIMSSSLAPLHYFRDCFLNHLNDWWLQFEEVISPLFVAWPCSLYLMCNEEQKEKSILVTRATEQYLGKMSNVVLCHPPQGFQHKQWEAEEALQRIPRWRWHPHQSKLFSFFLPFSFFPALLNAAQG